MRNGSTILRSVNSLEPRNLNGSAMFTLISMVLGLPVPAHNRYISFDSPLFTTNGVFVGAYTETGLDLLSIMTVVLLLLVNISDIMIMSGLALKPLNTPGSAVGIE